MVFKIIDFLTSKLKYIIIFYIVSALVYVFSTNVIYTSDSQYYFKLAQDLIEVSEFYPTTQHLYEDYIVSPFYVNILAGVLIIYNSTVSVCILNLLVISLQIFFLFKIVKRIFSESTANLTTLLFIFYLNTFGLVFLNLTELLFVLLVIISIYLLLLNSRAALFTAGFLLGISIAVRPLGLALIAAMLFLHLYIMIKEKKINLNMINVYAGTTLFIILFGSFTYFHFGNFEFTSTTGPVNLLLGANDDATGGFNAGVYEKGNIGYIEKPEFMTYKQKGDFYFNQAIKWIQDNPGKWITLIPLKIIHTFILDDVSITPLFGVKNWSLAKSLKKIVLEKNLKHSLPNTSIEKIVGYLSVQFIHHLFYYFLLFLIVSGIIDYLKGENRSSEIELVLIFSLISVLFITVTVGAPRYKYHIIILLLPIAANYLEGKLAKGRKEIVRS